MTKLSSALLRLRCRQVPRWAWVLILVVLVALRLLIAYCQRFYIEADASGLDETPMLEAAYSIINGNWLGNYGGFTLAKHMGFSLWLALLHVLRVPLLVGNAALWVAASAFVARALRPLVPGNLPRLALFAFFAFQPVSFAAYNLRVYRDAIFPACCLLFFAGVVGLALRLGEGRLRGPLLCAAGAGLGLAAAWLLREDGMVLLPFAFCGLGLVVVYIAAHKSLRRKVGLYLSALLPLLLLGAGIGAFSLANYQHYGVFLVSDMSGGTFPGAYGAVVAAAEGETGYHLRTPATKKAIKKLCKEVPSLKTLRPSLVEGPAFNGFADHETGDYGGSFYFALKLAAEYEGQTPDAPAAQAFWAGMQTEVEAAVAEGRLQSVKPSASTVPRWNGALLAPTAAEIGRSFKKVLLFEDCDPRGDFSTGSEDRIAAVAGFIHEPVLTGFAAGTDQPYYNALQRAVFTLCTVLIWVYRVLIWPLLALGLWGTGRALVQGVKSLARRRGFAPGLLGGVLSLGLLLSFALRITVASYMIEAAFTIPTFLMYLAGGVPALLLFCVLGALLLSPALSVQGTASGASGAREAP